MLLMGCREIALHHNLEELEADEILVALQQNGIVAKKEKELEGQEVSWTVLVQDKDLAPARQILITNSLPKRKELGLSGVYKDKGLIPTPDEQKARFLLALKGEIINSLEKIPGVIDADVILNVPQENELSELDPNKKRPTASVVIRTRNDEAVVHSMSEGKLQRFVANTVQNLDPNDVSVIITRGDPGMGPAQPTSPFAATQTSPVIAGTADHARGSLVSASPEDTVELAGIRLDKESVGRFKFYIIGLLMLVLAISVFLLYNIMRLNRMRMKVQRAGRSSRAALEGGQPQGYLGDGAQGGMAGTFDVNSGQRQA